MVFLPLAFIGQALGPFVGRYIAMIFEAWFAAAFLVELIPYIFAGGLGGYLSALVVSKIYKSFNLLSAMIISSLTILMALSGSLLLPIVKNNLASFDLNVTVSNAVLIISYYYFLKESKNL